MVTIVIQQVSIPHVYMPSMEACGELKGKEDVTYAL